MKETNDGKTIQDKNNNKNERKTSYVPGQNNSATANRNKEEDEKTTNVN